MQPTLFEFYVQLRHFIKLGIPDDMRGEVWNKMVGSQAIKVISSFDYQVNITIISSEKIKCWAYMYVGWKKEVMYFIWQCLFISV